MDKEEARAQLEQAIINYGMAISESTLEVEYGGDGGGSARSVLNAWTEVSRYLDKFAFECEPKTGMASGSSKTTQEPLRAVGLPNPCVSSENLSEAYLKSPCETMLLYRCLDRVNESKSGLPAFFSTEMIDFECPVDLNPHSKMLLASFVSALAMKMKKAEDKYGYLDKWKNQDWEDECRSDMDVHLEKGDMRDVAIYAAFMWYHGWKL